MAAWSFIAVLLAALAIAAPFAHLLELPVRRAYDPAVYVTVTHTLYRYFALVGGPIEVAATVAAVVWAVLVTRVRTVPSAARGWAWTGAACLLLAHALFWLLVAPVNAEFATWTPEAVPANWTRLRDQWELGHAVRAGLFVLGFCGLLASALVGRGPWPVRHGPLVGVARYRGENTE